jgi:hypothetical protein
MKVLKFEQIAFSSHMSIRWAWLTKEKVLKIDEYISNIWTLCKILEYFIMGFWKLGAQRG